MFFCYLLSVDKHGSIGQHSRHVVPLCGECVLVSIAICDGSIATNVVVANGHTVYEH